MPKYWQPKPIYNKARELSTNNSAFVGLLDTKSKSSQAKKNVSSRFPGQQEKRDSFVDLLIPLPVVSLSKS